MSRWEKDFIARFRMIPGEKNGGALSVWSRIFIFVPSIASWSPWSSPSRPVGSRIPTKTDIEARVWKKYGKKYKEFKKAILDAELKYRLLHNSILAGIQTKGKMLQSLRNVVQGNSGVGLDVSIGGIGGIGVDKIKT